MARHANDYERRGVMRTPIIGSLFPLRTLIRSLNALDHASVAEIIEGADLDRFFLKSVSFLDSVLAELLFKRNPWIVDNEFIRGQQNDNENGIAYKNIAHMHRKISELMRPTVVRLPFQM